MLKLPKGLKKKKKGKKSKKDKELFNEEELEQYRREHQQKPVEEEAGNQSENPSEHDDEWSKFNALTAGVDSILKKTQGDLNRIKETSFFQRVPTTSETKKVQEREEKEAAAEAAAVAAAVALEAEEARANYKQDFLAEAVVELSESESEAEEADDIFDTTYIDVIASGEVGLVNVPESPLDEEAEGPDPFDTSYADKVIKGPEVSSRGKKLVSIGSAVGVLTGKVETHSSIVSRRPRRGPKDFLLETVEQTEQQQIDFESTTSEPIKTLLDDPADEIPDIPIDLSVSLHLSLQKSKKEEEVAEAADNSSSFNILEEFDSINKGDTEVNDDDEFAQLAAESLTKNEDIQVITNLYKTAETASDWSSTFEGVISSGFILFEYVIICFNIFNCRETPTTATNVWTTFNKKSR